MGDVNGFVFIDKPKGLTTLQVVSEVRKILRAKKAGHGGSLDRNASGVLIIAVGEARKRLAEVLSLDKEYEGVLRLHREPGKGLNDVFKRFEGEIIQTPPKRSSVARKPRKRKVYSLNVLSVKGRDIKFRISCEPGLYVRKLASDIGEGLGGGHLQELSRTRAGRITLNECRSLEEFRRMPKLRDSLYL